MRELQQQIIARLGVKPEIDPGAEVQSRVDFLVNYVKHTGAKRLVLGISGGVDSTVAGRLCQLAVERVRAETPGAEVVFTAMRLPYHVQFDEDDAQAAVKFIAPDQAVTLPIGEATDALAEDFAYGVGEKISDYNKGNVKARMRMISQYAVAGIDGGLVVGSDHAAEAITGFFTKFGDGGADVMPLAGLTKSQVRQLGQYLGADERLWAKVPTADLLSDNPGRTDEDELGISYADIDAYLVGDSIDPAVAEKLEEIYLRSEHKRRTPVTPHDNWW